MSPLELVNGWGSSLLSAVYLPSFGPIDSTRQPECDFLCIAGTCLHKLRILAEMFEVMSGFPKERLPEYFEVRSY